MNLRTATLLVAITQCLDALGSTFNLVHNLMELTWRRGWQYLIMSPVYILADIALAIFFFVLYSRQKST